MRFESSLVIRASKEKVWDFIMNVEKLADCIPGCESIEIINEKTFRSKITSKVAFLSVKFTSTTNITEIDAPNMLSAITMGKDNLVHTSVNIKSGFRLDALSENETKFSNWCDVGIVGKLATFGEATIRGKGKKVLTEFEQILKERIEVS
jgi:carbon monoxide dehydrogenase subunit G